MILAFELHTSTLGQGLFHTVNRRDSVRGSDKFFLSPPSIQCLFYFLSERILTLYLIQAPVYDAIVYQKSSCRDLATAWLIITMTIADFVHIFNSSPFWSQTTNGVFPLQHKDAPPQALLLPSTPPPQPLFNVRFLSVICTTCTDFIEAC